MFKVGDRVIEISTGDVGTITAPYDGPERILPEQYWWVEWDNDGKFFIQESDIKHITPTSRFKVGDRVKVRDGKGTGTIASKLVPSAYAPGMYPDVDDAWWVKWDEDGEELYIREGDMEHIPTGDPLPLFVTAAIEMLEQLGYTITPPVEEKKRV